MLKKSKLLATGFVLALLLSTQAQAATIFGDSVNWNFQEFNNSKINPNKVRNAPFDYEPETFDWANAHNWSTQSSGRFTNNRDVALQTKINVDGIVDNLMLKVAVDDSFMLRVNGQTLKATYGDHGHGYWNYIWNSSALDESLFMPGENTIQVLVNDNQHVTYFDMEMTGDITPAPVPEPSSMLLGIMSIAGALRLRRKK